MDYEKLLEKATKELPESAKEKQRFEIPNVKGHVEGNKTVVSNFVQIATLLQRPVEHFIKYILKELATPGDIRNNQLILKTKIPASKNDFAFSQLALALIKSLWFSQK